VRAIVLILVLLVVAGCTWVEPSPHPWHVAQDWHL
jgi:hypothetical protein